MVTKKRRQIMKSSVEQKKEVPLRRNFLQSGTQSKRAAATYSPAIRSTIGADGLNFSVRNGKRWNPDTITTIMS